MDIKIDLEEVSAGLRLEEGALIALRFSVRLAGVAVAAWAALRLVRFLVGRIDDHRIREQLLFFLPKLIGLFAVIGAIAAVGIDVSGMAALMATIGFTGAVVFTPVGQNFVAGAMIRIDDVYEVGDAVTVNDLHGTVVYRSLLRTEIELPDGSKAWVPNSVFQENEVLNHSRLGGWRICVQVPLDRVTDRRKAQQIMGEVMDTLPWNQPDKPAFVVFDHVGGEAMFFNAYAWIADRTQEPWFRGLLLDALVDALEAQGVSVGQTTNLSIGATRRDADGANPADDPTVADDGPPPVASTGRGRIAVGRSRWRR